MTASAKSGGLESWLGRAAARVGDVFFAKKEPFDLAILRIIFYGFLIRSHRRTDWVPYRDTLFEPVGIFELLPFPPANVIELMHVVWPAAAACALVGLGFRPAALIVLAGAPYMLGLGNNFGKVDHSANLLTVMTFVMAFSRADAALSVRAWWRHWRGLSPAQPSGHFRWPIRMAWLLIASMYFSAGISKLTASGWDWALSDNLQILLARHHFTHHPVTDVGLWFLQYPLLCRGLALGSLLLELAAPAMMLGGVFTLLLGGGVASLQLGIYLSLGVGFSKMIPVFASLVPWQWLFDRAKRLAFWRRGNPPN